MTAAIVLHRSLIVAAMLLMACAGGADEHTLSSPVVTGASGDAAELLRKVAATYAAAASYVDEGVVVTTFTGPDGPPHTTRKPFRTWFARGRAFRFEFTGEAPRTKYVAWTEGDSVLSWWTVRPRVERHRSIADALSGPTGVSGGSAHTIPTLLLGEAGAGWRITDLHAPRIVGEQRLEEGEVCLVVEGQHPRSMQRTFTLWIDKSSSMIRRISAPSQLEGGTTVENTTTYKPSFDQRVDEREIRFQPPS